MSMTDGDDGDDADGLRMTTAMTDGDEDDDYDRTLPSPRLLCSLHVGGVSYPVTEII